MNPQPKTKRIKSENYLKWELTQPCCLTGDHKTDDMDVVYSHETVRIPSSCKGTAQKDHDPWSLPMRKDLHDLSHTGVDVFELYGVDKNELIIEHMTRFLQQGNKF